MTIDAIGSRSGSAELPGTEAAGGEKFAAAVSRLINDVNRDQIEAARKIEDLTVHGRGTIHETMIAMSKAEGSFRLLMEMRNRIIDGVNQLLQSST
jgi:flagellar hook-basal body complex protein FliE